jgi:hypothetical protein
MFQIVRFMTLENVFTTYDMVPRPVLEAAMKTVRPAGQSSDGSPLYMESDIDQAIIRLVRRLRGLPFEQIGDWQPEEEITTATQSEAMLQSQISQRIDEALPPIDDPQPQSEKTPRQDDLGKPKLVLSRDDFSVQYKARLCQLGNVMAFTLLERLNRSPGIYIPLDRLIIDVWKGTVVSNEAVQKQASILRKKLRKAGINGITIDGKQKDHYRLVLT